MAFAGVIFGLAQVGVNVFHGGDGFYGYRLALETLVCVAPLYVACGIADVDPVKTFARLLTHYALPLLGIGVLIIVGVMPV